MGKNVTKKELDSLSTDLPPDSEEYARAAEHAEAKKHPHARRKIIIAAAIVTSLILLTLAGVATFFYHKNGSLRRYDAIGIPFSATTDHAQFAQTLHERIDSYKFTVKGENDTKSFTASEIGLKADGEKTIQNIISTRQKTSTIDNLKFWETTSLPVELTTDPSVFATFVDTELIHTTIEPQNATLTTEDGMLDITPEQPGEAWTIKNPENTILSAVSRVAPNFTITLTKQPLAPKVTAAEAQKIAAEIREVAKTPISVVIDDEEVAADQTTIMSWVDPLDNSTTKARFEINSGKVQAWLDDVAYWHTLKTINEVSVRQPDGSTRIITYGRNGRTIRQSDDIAKDIVAHLNNKKPVQKTLVVETDPYKETTVNQYDKWLLADLSHSMIYAYEKNTLVRSFPMSAGAPETPTVIGEYKIYSKVRSQTMRGPNVDGTSYSVPNVEWVSYFHQDYAIHGNYWRPASVFGALNTSHGCIGMPNASSQWVYEWAPIGTPVITTN